MKEVSEPSFAHWLCIINNLITCVEECQAEQKHFSCEEEIHRVFKGNQHAARWTVQFIIGIVIGAINDTCVLEWPESGKEEKANYADTDEDGEHESSRRFVDVSFALELEEHEQVAEKHATVGKRRKSISFTCCRMRLKLLG